MNLSNYAFKIGTDGLLYVDCIHPAPLGPTEYYRAARWVDMDKEKETGGAD